MPNKIKTTQTENLLEPSGRDLFQKPNYATKLLLPFLDKFFDYIVWECAAGERKISNILTSKGFNVISTDIRYSQEVVRHNFLIDNIPDFIDLKNKNYIIITNPPFSLKKKFYLKCLEYRIPFALLIPADYSGWLIKAIQEGAEKIVPERRIDYITPTGLSGANGHSANFHSIWLTQGFSLGKSETFVKLNDEMKKDI